MNNTELLKALHQHIEILRASIEMLEIRVNFFENHLEQTNPETWAQYQYFVFDEVQRLEKDGRSALSCLPERPKFDD